MPAYCGSKFYSNLNKGDACPTGGVATFSPNGTNEPEAASAIGEASSLTPTVQWNVNNSPVKVKRPGASYSGGIPAGEVETTIPYYEAQQIANELRGQGGKKYDDFVNKLRGYTGSELGTVGGVDTAWNTVLTDAYSAGVNAFDLLDRGPSMIDKETPGAGVGGGGVGAYTGPRTTTSVSVTAKEDVERTLNTFAVDMLGRNLTDDELNKYTAQYREKEMGAPQVTTTTPRGPAATTSVTEQTVSRETIAQNILQDNPMFADNVIKTDVLDMFFNRLGGASSGS